VDGWNQEEAEEIVTGRRMRAGRRRIPTSGLRWVVIAVVILVVVGGGVAGFLYLTRPTGLAALPAQAVVTPGGFRASIGANNTITVGLEIRNAADIPITVVAARIVAPPGLTSVALTVVPTGPDNEGFKLEGDLPAPAPIQLGVDAADRNAIVAARFTVNCSGLLGGAPATGRPSGTPSAGTVGASDQPSGEQIFVTIEVSGQQRVEELTPPVVGDAPWLTATAHRVCLDPLPTTSAQPPLSPLPDQPVGSNPTSGG
jgi:hypothetical protein